ncbi:hypothetical protein KCU88_g2010, partial [Aureobasidium melanogenum]
MPLLLLDLPPEIRLQIWTQIIQPTQIYPCSCAAAQQNSKPESKESKPTSLRSVGKCKATRLGPCCHNTSTYHHCDNRVLRVNRQILHEILPVIVQKQAEPQQRRAFILCNNLRLDNFFKSLNRTGWRWVQHLRVDLFMGYRDSDSDGPRSSSSSSSSSNPDKDNNNNNDNDWFAVSAETQRWTKTYVASALNAYQQGRRLDVKVADEIKEEDGTGRRTVTADIYLD